jgi:hypothetical protein
VQVKKYFSEYITYILQSLQNNETDFSSLKKEMLVKIQFMQHERLIHFMVTMLFALLLFITMGIFMMSQMYAFLIVSALMLALIIPYVAHYFFLENGVQQLYRLYDDVCEKAKMQESAAL